MAKYRINSGSFCYKGVTHDAGNVFDCDLNLRDRNIPGVSERYTLVEGSVDEIGGGTLNATLDDPLGEKTIAELKAFAEEQGIDLGEATKKQDILVILREILE